MKYGSITRRNFIKNTAWLAAPALLPGSSLLANNNVPAANTKAPLHWLEEGKSAFANGVSWGVPWPKGVYKADTSFTLKNASGKALPLQTWPLAWWPDGTLKWTGHAAAGIDTKSIYHVEAGKSATSSVAINLSDKEAEIVVDTGSLRCTINKYGSNFIKSLQLNGNTVGKEGKLIIWVQNSPDEDLGTSTKRAELVSNISSVTVEQKGAMRTVVKVTGIHAGNGLQLLPFVLRLYFYAGSDEVEIRHTLVYDADEQQHFIKAIGLSLQVPLSGELYNRHIRFANSNDEGVFAEAVKGLTGLRRSPGDEVMQQQLKGQAVAPPEQLPISSLLQYIPAFGDYTLYQGSSSSFSIRKRTSTGHSWLTSATGERALGTVYLGTPTGGIAAGIRNFWQSFPTQLDVRHAATDTATINLWFWAPEAPAMDLRFYHDGLGQHTYAKQREGLEITYEDYEPGFGTPHGVARTSTIVLKALSGTPQNSELHAIAQQIQAPSTLICHHEYLEAQKVFGGNWSIDKTPSPAAALLEKQLDTYFNFYKKQVDERNWYGFWNYGDVMHSYDEQRHTWKYDVGGFAWDNSELSTDLWLWYYYLKTQRTDVFRMAEAMTKHTGEVDVHHIGRFAPLGSRHNVMHWGCSAKQMRISTAANRRFYYYLTTDERTGDLLHEQVNAAEALSRIQPTRKVANNGLQPDTYTSTRIPASFGTDYGAIAAAWLTEWERTNSKPLYEKLINSMTTIAAQPHGFYTGQSTLHLDTGKFEISSSNAVSASHLNAVFGLTEIVEELISLINIPAFTKAWLQYCRLYNATEQEQQQELGHSFEKLNLGQGHSRLTAYAAYTLNDEKLAQRAWKEFYQGKAGMIPGHVEIHTISGSSVFHPIEEGEHISTNGVAQWGLAAIQCLAFAGKYLPEQP